MVDPTQFLSLDWATLGDLAPEVLEVILVYVAKYGWLSLL